MVLLPEGVLCVSVAPASGACGWFWVVATSVCASASVPGSGAACAAVLDNAMGGAKLRAKTKHHSRTLVRTRPGAQEGLGEPSSRGGGVFFAC